MNFNRGFVLRSVVLIVFTVALGLSVLSWTMQRIPRQPDGGGSFVNDTVLGDIAESCVVDESIGFIKEEDGQIGIYSGDQDGCHELQTVFDFDSDELNEDVRQALDKGIAYYNSADLPQILDGLLSTD